MKEPVLGIATMHFRNGKLEEQRVLKHFIREARQLGIKAFVFCPDDLDDELRTVTARILTQQGRWQLKKGVRLPDLVYDRCRFRGSPLRHKMKRLRESRPKTVFINSTLANKWIVHQALAENPKLTPWLPETFLLKSAAQLQHYLQNHGIAYLKPINGTGGRGVLRVRRAGKWLQASGRDLERRIIPVWHCTPKALIRRLTRWKKTYLMQQAIDTSGPDGRVRDIRILVQKNAQGQWKVTGGAGRVGGRGSVTSNLHGGGEAVRLSTLLSSLVQTPKDLESLLEEMSLTVAETAEKRFGRLCELGLDIALDRRGHPWILEVNPKPAREVFRRIHDLAVYQKAVRRPMEYAKWLYEQQSEP